jgi:hypothetical protein
MEPYLERQEELRYVACSKELLKAKEGSQTSCFVLGGKESPKPRSDGCISRGA